MSVNKENMKFLQLSAFEMDESRLRIIMKKIIKHSEAGNIPNGNLASRCKELLDRPHELGGFNVGY
jgi:hypothetical protein